MGHSAKIRHRRARRVWRAIARKGQREATLRSFMPALTAHQGIYVELTPAQVTAINRALLDQLNAICVGPAVDVERGFSWD